MYLQNNGTITKEIWDYRIEGCVNSNLSKIY